MARIAASLPLNSLDVLRLPTMQGRLPRTTREQFVRIDPTEVGTHRFRCAVVLASVFALLSVPLIANPVVVAIGKYAVEFAASYLLGKGIDEIWDASTNKPDIRALDQRLEVLEGELRTLDAQLGDAVLALREEVDRDTGLEEYRSLASKTLADITYRITRLEARVSNNEAAIADLEARVRALEGKIPPATDLEEDPPLKFESRKQAPDPSRFETLRRDSRQEPPVGHYAISTWEKTFGSGDREISSEVRALSNGQFVLTVYSNSPGMGSNYWTLGAYGIDSDGRKIWERTFSPEPIQDRPGLREFKRSDLEFADNGDFIIAYRQGGMGFRVNRLSSGEGSIWERSYGRTRYEGFYDASLVGDEIFIAGIDSGTRSWIMKLDFDGNLLWDYKTQVTNEPSSYRYGGIIKATTGGGCIAAGLSHIEGRDLWVIRLDSRGRRMWERSIVGNSWDQPTRILPSGDGGYYIAGFTNSWGSGGFDGWLIKIDRNGEPLWQRTFGGRKWDSITDLVPGNSGGLIGTGFTQSKGGGDFDLWMLRLDDRGSLLWDRTYGGSETDVGYSIAPAADGGYVVAGFTWSKGAGQDDVWLLKVDEDGEID